MESGRQQWEIFLGKGKEKYLHGPKISRGHIFDQLCKYIMHHYVMLPNHVNISQRRELI